VVIRNSVCRIICRFFLANSGFYQALLLTDFPSSHNSTPSRGYAGVRSA
jgi:hypothetical protein